MGSRAVVPPLPLCAFVRPLSAARAASFGLIGGMRATRCWALRPQKTWRLVRFIRGFRKVRSVRARWGLAPRWPGARAGPQAPRWIALGCSNASEPQLGAVAARRLRRVCGGSAGSAELPCGGRDPRRRGAGPGRRRPGWQHRAPSGWCSRVRSPRRGGSNRRQHGVCGGPGRVDDELASKMRVSLRVESPFLAHWGAVGQRRPARGESMAQALHTARQRLREHDATVRECVQAVESHRVKTVDATTPRVPPPGLTSIRSGPLRCSSCAPAAPPSWLARPSVDGWLEPRDRGGDRGERHAAHRGVRRAARAQSGLPLSSAGDRPALKGHGARVHLAERGCPPPRARAARVAPGSPRQGKKLGSLGRTLGT